MDSSWIFRILLVMATIVIIFGDFLGYGGANARKSDKNENSVESHEKSQQTTPSTHQYGNIYMSDTIKTDDDILGENEDAVVDKINLKFLSKPLTDKQKKKYKENFVIVKEKISESLRDLCLPKLLCEIAAKPAYLLSEKERLVLSLLKTTTLSIVAETPSRWHFSAHMGQLMRHSVDSMGCANLFPNCPYSSEKLMKMSGKVRLS